MMPSVIHRLIDCRVYLRFRHVLNSFRELVAEIEKPLVGSF